MFAIPWLDESLSYAPESAAQGASKSIGRESLDSKAFMRPYWRCRCCMDFCPTQRSFVEISFDGFEQYRTRLIGQIDRRFRCTCMPCPKDWVRAGTYLNPRSIPTSTPELLRYTICSLFCELADVLAGVLAPS